MPIAFCCDSDTWDLWLKQTKIFKNCLLCLSVFVLLEYSWLYVKTLLGDFWKLLVTNFLPNLTQMHGHIVYFYVTLMCLLIEYFSRKLGHFLFQPLITLNSYCLLNSSFSPTLGIQVPTYCTNRLNISSNVHCIQTQLSWVNTIRNASPS